MRKRPLVVVTWHDAVEHDDGGPKKPEHRPAVQHTSGFLLKSNKRGVSLATELNGDGSGWRGENFIPRGMVVKIKRYKRTRAR